MTKSEKIQELEIRMSEKRSSITMLEGCVERLRFGHDVAMLEHFLRALNTARADYRAIGRVWCKLIF